MKLSDGNVLDIVYAGTGYQSGLLLSDMSANSVWKALCACWLHLYLGPPDTLYHDAGTNFSSALLKEECVSAGMVVREVPNRGACSDLSS